MRSVEELGAFRTVERHPVVPDAPSVPVPVAEMTAAGLTPARVPPLRGRYLVEDDERAGAPPVVVIEYDVWQSRFAGDSAVVGRTVCLATTMHTIAGVMPDSGGFRQSHEYWTWLRVSSSSYARREGSDIFIFSRLAFVRLAPGVSMERAPVELAVVGQRTAAASPNRTRGCSRWS